jgi:hypothetical protein
MGLSNHDPRREAERLLGGEKPKREASPMARLLERSRSEDVSAGEIEQAMRAEQTWRCSL